jgi:hypothetical protein
MPSLKRGNYSDRYPDGQLPLQLWGPKGWSEEGVGIANISQAPANLRVANFILLSNG